MCQKRREVKNSDSRGDVRKRQSVNDKRPLSSHRPITAVITLRRSCQTLLHETHQSLAIIQVFRECPCSHASAASLYCSLMSVSDGFRMSTYTLFSYTHMVLHPPAEFAHLSQVHLCFCIIVTYHSRDREQQGVGERDTCRVTVYCTNVLLTGCFK